MIRSQLQPGCRIFWRNQGRNSFGGRGQGILLGKKNGHLEIYVEKLVNSKIDSTNLGIKLYKEIEIFITDKEEILLDELLTSDLIVVRKIALRLLQMGD